MTFIGTMWNSQIESETGGQVIGLTLSPEDLQVSDTFMSSTKISL